MTSIRHCQCGSTLNIFSSSTAAVAFVTAGWQAIHTGAGHGPATRAQARNARRRKRYQQHRAVMEASS